MAGDIINWDIVHDIHGRFVTCQRPILLQIKCPDVAVLYFKAEMQIKEPAIQGDDWIYTDVVCRGYHDKDFNTFTFNFAEYVKNYFAVNYLWINQALCQVIPASETWKEMFQRDFRFRIYPVVIQEDGTSVDVTDDDKYSRRFSVVELNTKGNEITCSWFNDKIRIDNFVNGTCDGASYDNTYGELDYLGPEYHRAMTNMPGLTPAGDPDYNGVHNVINTNDGLFHCLTSPWIYYPNKFQRIRYKIRNATTGAWSSYDVDTIFGSPLSYGNTGGADNELIYYQVNPWVVDVILTDTQGVGDYIFDSVGNLVADRFSIKITTRTASSEYRSGPRYSFDLTDKKNNGKCNRVKFVFKNMRGGIDWFHCTGTQNKEVDMKSTTYKIYQPLMRGDTGFGMTPSHCNTNLWTSRTESFTVTTQPLNKEWANWVEELIVSPQVWIEVEYDNIRDAEYAETYPRNNQLIPVLIDPGSYKIYSTEDNMHFVEFKYKLSDNTLTQQGY